MRTKLILLIVSILSQGCAEGTHSQPDPISMNKVAMAANDDMTCLPGRSSLISLDGSAISMTGNVRTDGSVFLSETSVLSMSGNVHIGGQLILVPGAQYTGSGSVSIAESTIAAETDARFTMLLLRNFMGNMVAHQSVGSVRSSSRWVSRGGVNTVDVAGNVELSGKNKIILSGAAEDKFLVRIYGDVKMSGQSAIELEGGLLAKNVVIEILGEGKSFDVSGQTSIAGTLISFGRPVRMSGSSSMMGAIISDREVRLSGNIRFKNPGEYCVNLQ